MSQGKLASEKVVIQSPTSFTGSAKRIWKMTDVGNPVAKVLLSIVALTLIGFVWTFVVVWYLMWGIFIIPWRLIRRGARRRKRDALRHREMLAATAPRPPMPVAASAPPAQTALPPSDG